MKKLLLAGVAVGALAAATPADSADLPMPMNPYIAPPPAVFSWSGCSVGGHLGWGWSTTRFRDAPGTFSSTALIDFSGLGRSSAVSGNGGIFGGQLGCDYQFTPNFVAGVQFSAAGSTLSGSAIDPFAFGSTLQAKTDFLADISGRLGFAWDRMLFYGKGGAAFANNSYLFTASPAAAAVSGGFFTSSGSDTPFGGVLGAGIEWAFAPNWSAFLEYDHYFFATDNVTFNSAGFLNFVRVNQDIDAVKAGVNYRFNFWRDPYPYRY